MNKTQQWQKYPIIANDLSAVNQFLLENIQTRHHELKDALLAMANNGGKYLRPALLFLSAKAAGKKQHDHDQLIKLAASIEILHMATLIHDDIIDDSDKRRGKISIQAEFGKDVAVYAGDLLFTHFFDLILSATNEHHYLEKNAFAMHHVLDGELGQMGKRFDLSQNLDDYLNNVKGKTAALLRLAAEEGAHFAGADHQTTRLMAEFGENLGVAFQIVDDILDYTGGKNLNKPTLEDLATGVYSLPLLLALRHRELKQQLQPLLSKKWNMTVEDINRVQEILLSNDIISESRNFAKHYSDLALANLKALPLSPARELLKQITKQMLNRTK